MDGSRALVQTLLDDVQGHIEVLTQPRSEAWADPQHKRFDEQYARKVDVVRVRMTHKGLEIVGQEGSSKERGLTFRLHIPFAALSSFSAAAALAVEQDRNHQIQVAELYRKQWHEALQSKPSST